MFSWLREFLLKIKPKILFSSQDDFLGHVLSATEVSANPEKVIQLRDWLVTKNAKELHSFLRLAFYYQRLIANFIQKAKGLQQIISPTSM